PENLAGASVAQGSGAIGTASANNLGGVVQYASDAPRGTEGFSLRQTVGAASAYRTSGRWDSGLHMFGNNGINGFLSFTRQDNDKWKGAGDPASPSFSGILGSHGLFHTGAVWHGHADAPAAPILCANDRHGHDTFAYRQESHQ